MKHLLLLFVVCFGASLAASGQTLGTSAANMRPQMIVLQDEPQHASQTPMAQEHDLLEHGGSSYARGEKPLWEVVSETKPTPLGDLARELRLEHAAARKAVIFWVN